MLKNDYTSAILSFTTATELDPTNAIYYSNRATAYSLEGEHLKAVEDANRVLQLDPSSTNAYTRLGYADSTPPAYLD
jgi:small glutamine-rich tetratricopeptide repeat-containing protein alpha